MLSDSLGRRVCPQCTYSSDHLPALFAQSEFVRAFGAQVPPARRSLQSELCRLHIPARDMQGVKFAILQGFRTKQEQRIRCRCDTHAALHCIPDVLAFGFTAVVDGDDRGLCLFAQQAQVCPGAVVLFVRVAVGYQPTYKGLKRPLCGLFMSYASYQPTYKGLKPRITSIFAYSDMSYQPTYKGLKLLARFQ